MTLALIFMYTTGWPVRAGNILTERVCLNNGKQKYCWEPNDAQKWNYTEFWEQQQPFLVGDRVDRVVFHMRCGDILTHGGAGYRFACDNCIKTLAPWYKNATRALIIAAGHQSNALRDARCGELAMHYSKVISKVIPHVSIEFTNSPEHDWNVMHIARKVVAIVPSSFSFSAKVGRLNELKILGLDGSPWLHPCGSTKPKAWSKEFDEELATC